MNIKQIKGNTFCIDTGMSYIPFYKVSDREIIMLDSGWNRGGEPEGIKEVLEKNKFKVLGIICSHVHTDHIGNNAYLKRKYKCTIAMPSYEAFICSSPNYLKLYFHDQTLSDITENFGDILFKTDIMIEDNQSEVDICNVKFKILHTPGHSPSHICIITPDNVAYLGDCLISYDVMKGAKMPYAYILNQDLESKEKLYDFNYDKYIVAHKGIYDDIKKLVYDNIEFYKGRAMGVYSVIKQRPMTVEDIFKACVKKFKINIKDRYKYNIVERMLCSYVEYLNEKGFIELNMVNGFLKYTRCNLNKQDLQKAL